MQWPTQETTKLENMSPFNVEHNNNNFVNMLLTSVCVAGMLTGGSSFTLSCCLITIVNLDKGTGGRRFVLSDERPQTNFSLRLS